MSRVDLKALVGLILLSQYYHVVVRKSRGSDILLQATSTPSLSLLYSTIVLYDIGSVLYRLVYMCTLIYYHTTCLNK